MNNTVRLLLRYRAKPMTLAGARAPFYVSQNMPALPHAQPQVTNDNWNGGAGNWSNASLWSLGTVPTSSNNAVISAASSSVTLDVSGTVNNLTVGSAATLNFNNNVNLTVDGSSITDSNRTGSGGITLNSTGNSTELIIGGANVTLSGGGVLTMSNNTNNYIYGSAAANILTNQDTIQGAGQIGDGQMALVNQGTINANQTNTLTIRTSNGVTNTGTLEATNAATLVLQGDTYTDTGGTIQALGTGSTVNINGVTVNGGTFTTSTGGIINAQSNTLLNGITNSGTLQIPNNNTVLLEGTITNSGTISLASGGNTTALELNGASVTLTGGGTVTLSNNANNYIYGAAATDVLTNVNNTISGSGVIGDAQMALVNEATIDANQSTQLIIDTAKGTTNTGTLEATSGATLLLENDTFTNTGGSIKAVGTGSVVNIQNATVNGGTVSSSGGGLIQSLGSSTTFSGLTTSGTVAVPNNNDLTLAGTITNTGGIQVNSGGNSTELVISGAVTLTGGGTVTLSDNNNNYILASATGNSLTNVNNTISGSGNIGNSNMAFTNDATGVVDATSANHNVLSIQPGTPGATNLGLMEASSGGELQLYNTITNFSGSTNGTIEALNGGTVVLNGASIGGGTLTSAGTGVVLLENNAQLDGSASTISVSGTLQVPNSNLTFLKGTINNTGTISLNSNGNATYLDVNSSTVTLEGSGTINISDNNNNYITGAASGNQLINQQTIQGPGGNIGLGVLTITNQGTIDATVSASGNILTIQPGSGGLTNTGLLEATGGGVLALDGSTFTNTGATITAGSGSTVNLDGSVTVVGGTLNGAGTFNAFTNATLSGLTNASTVQVANNNELTVVGTITNTGSIVLNSVGNATYLLPSGAVTLTGGGSVTLSDNNNNYFAAGASGSSVTNVNNRISGSGNIGLGGLGFTNESGGTVDATSSQGNILTIEPGSAGAVNQGTFEASSGGTLVIDNTVTNTGGTITALAGTGSAAGGSVVINGATITGGTLNTLGTGVNAGTMTIQSGGVLSGVTNLGTIALPNNNQAQLEGTITNNGSIQVNSVGNGTYLFFNGNTTLNGTGTIVLSNNSNNYVEGAAGTEVLTSSNTIEGGGNLGNGTLGIVNKGEILANDSTELVVNTNSSGLTNNGTLAVTAGSTLNITGGPFTNFNSSTNTLTGGTYSVGGTLEFVGANIVTNAANIVLTDSTGEIISNTSANALANFATNATGASFNLQGGASFTTSGNFTNNGSLTVGGSDKFEVSGSLTNFASSTLTGGTYNVAGTLEFGATGSSLTTNDANLTLSGPNAKVQNLGGGNLLTAFATNDSGATFTVSSGGSFTTGGAFTNAGTLDLEQGSSLTIAGNLTNTGTTTTNGSNLGGAANTLTVTGTLTNSGTGTVTIGANNDTTDVAKVGLLANSAPITVATGATLDLTTAGTDTNTSTITLNGATLKIGATETLSGSHGVVDLSNSATNLITGGASNLTFTNAETIEGSGSISNLKILNTGELLANQSTPLIILPSSGGLTNKGTLAVSSGSTMEIGTSAGGALTNFAGTTLTGGTYNVTGTLQFGASGTSLLTNAATITLTGATAQIIDFGNNNILAGFDDNSATGKFTVAAGAAFTTSSASFTNAGILDIMKGTKFTGGSAFDFTQTGGTLTVDGTLTSTTLGTVNLNGGSLFGIGTVNEKVIDSAILTPGDSATSTGSLAVKNTYTQTATGALDIALDGTTTGKFDVLNVTKAATLNGTLNISLVTGFVPTVGSTFDILNASSITGTFATINGTSINSSEHFTVTVNGTDVVLTVVAGPGTNTTTALFSNSLRHRSHLAPPASTVNAGSGYGYGLGLLRPATGSFPAPTPVSAPVMGRGYGVHRLDDGISAPAFTASSSAGSGLSGPVFAAPSVSAGAFNNMARQDHMRFEVGVDAKALLKTSPRRLLKALVADPDSKDALSLGYVTFTNSH